MRREPDWFLCGLALLLLSRSYEKDDIMRLLFAILSIAYTTIFFMDWLSGWWKNR